MFIETLIVGAVVGAASAARHSIREHRAERTERKLAELQFRTLLTTQEIQAQATAARRAMVNEVRRHGGVNTLRGQ
jgi:predicted transcriptional regulator